MSTSINCKNVLIFMGPPGSGKGSISQKLKDKFGWEQLSTGNLCRQNIAEQTEIGKIMDFAIKSGKLISDELITSMVIDWFSSSAMNNETVILDGFPRTLCQAQQFDEFLSKSNINLKIVNFLIADDEVVKRVSSRLVCQNKICQKVYSEIAIDLKPQVSGKCDKCNDSLIRRADDNPVCIKDRLLVFHKHSNELIKFYKKLGRLFIEVSCQAEPDNVFDNFIKLLELPAV